MSTPSTELNSSEKRKRGLLILAAVVVVGLLAYTAYWFFVARFYETTDDAYVASDIVQITSEIPGTVLSVRVDDTQRIEQGQPLVELDPADARVRVAAAEADLARAVRQVRGLYSQADQLRAQIAERSTELQQAQGDFTRREGLVSYGAVSGEELAHSRDAITRVKSALEGAHQQLDATTAQIEGTTISTHPEVLAAAAKYHDAALSLRRTTIEAPVTGVIAKRGVQVGQRVAAGAPLMAVVPLDAVWVDANFKEGQLKDVRVGQPVSLHADLYGGDADYRGTVVGVSAGSGSAFALLPSQNASGNWIKIVQRLPVRIALNAEDLKRHPLRVGLSMRARIDVRDTSGTLVAAEVRATPQVTQKSVGDDPAIDERVAEIIRQNSAMPAAVAATRHKRAAATRPAKVASAS
jgi:membrane fusion protein, multidrug efflux system